MKNNTNTYKKLLREFIAFKSISTDPQFAGEITKTVNWLKRQFTTKGFKVETIKGYGNPLVLATLVIDSKLPTVLVYGHYDVQPANKSDGWKSEPFTVYENGGHLYARGIVDNKGQILSHIASVFELFNKKKLKYSVKFLIEGDEETGSEHIEKFFKDNYKKLKSDFVLISDGELTGIHPCFDSSFRGVVNLSLRIKTSNKDNHSGLYGGSIPNAANELSRILTKMHDDNGNLQISELNTTQNFDKDIIRNNKGIPYLRSEFLNITGAKKRFNEKDLDFYTQTGFLTSAEISTLISGYMGDGFRNAIPGKAEAKINFRLAPNLTVKDFMVVIRKYFKKVIPSYIEYKISEKQSSDGFLVDTKNEFAQNTKVILKSAYGAEVYDRPCGAIIPIVGLFIKYLKVPLVSVGLANEDCNMHGANENLKIDALKKALIFSNRFFSK